MTTVLGTCHHDCPDTCGWVATVEDGRIVRLRGNPDHPYSRGELCPKVNRLPDRVYAEDRLLRPLVRTGPKGAGEFRETTWDEALALVAERVGAIVDEHGGDAVLPWWDAGTQGTIQMSGLDRRFFHALGASRLNGSVCGTTAQHGFASTYGSSFGADPTDLVHSELVILWATNTRLTNRHLWPFVEEARANGAEIVVIDPLRTVTADAADRFIQPLPSTDSALIAALIHILIRDDLIDHDYVERYTTGFDALCEYVTEWTPARAAQVTGLEVDEIEWLAARYGGARPAFIRTLIGGEHNENGARFFRSLGCLPLLTGSWRYRGGGLSKSVGAWGGLVVDDSLFDPAPDDRPLPRSVNMPRLGAALTELDPPIRALFIWCGNPLISLPNSMLVRSGLERDDLFTVVSEQFMTDTAHYADVVFPATTQLEQFDVMSSWGHLYVGWNEKAVEPLGEAVPNTELWRRLAAAMGIEDPLFELDDLELARRCVVGADPDELRSRGFVATASGDSTHLYARGGFSTPSGRAELWSGDLDPAGERTPGYAEAVEGVWGNDAEHPLVLLSPKTHTRFLNTTYSHHHGPMEKGPWIELDPADAAARGLLDGRTARVHNRRGSLELPVRVTERLRPGVAAIPWGWWGLEKAVNVLTSDTPTDWGGGVAYCDTRVEVSPIARDV